MNRRAVITGIGAVTPLGTGAQALHDRWCAGESGIADGVARCHDVDLASAMTRRDIRRTDRFVHLAMVAAQEAVVQAGWSDGPPCEPERAGCIVGTAMGGTMGVIKLQRVHDEQGPDAVSPHVVPQLMCNSAAGYLAIRHGLRGPAFATVSACAAGAHALGEALRAIRCGDCDVVVCGGTDAPIDKYLMAAFRTMGALSPTGRSLPFDSRRDGFVMGEGAAILVLEAVEVAEARGAEILGELVGYGSTDDAFHITAPADDGSAAAAAITACLRDAGAQPADVAYVNAHGTATQFNDLVETRALHSALGGHAGSIAVSSTKSVIGHTIGAAGAVEAVATLLALRARVAPPTVGLEQQDPELDLDYVAGTARPMPPGHVALSNSFGFGGHNVVLALAA